ncbi:hypothetical protein EJ06DRAFT_454528, partial [Trichodelitschia bisporula]
TASSQQVDASGKPHLESYKCHLCIDEFPASEIIALSCTHASCTDCLKALFLHATANEAQFPPRCCRPIPLALIAPALSSAEYSAYVAASEEFSTPNRTYCSNRTCGRFISPNYISAELAICSACGTSTCAHCKNSAHADACSSDEDLQAVLALAKEKGWRRCGQCRNMVEKTVGCYHISCTCGFQWCYLCGEKWKGCDC